MSALLECSQSNSKPGNTCCIRYNVTFDHRLIVSLIVIIRGSHTTQLKMISCQLILSKHKYSCLDLCTAQTLKFPPFLVLDPSAVGVLLIQGFWKDPAWWITETLSVSLNLWFPFRFSHCHQTDLSKSLSVVCLYSMFLFMCVCGSRSRFHSKWDWCHRNTSCGASFCSDSITKSYFAFQNTERNS